MLRNLERRADLETREARKKEGKRDLKVEYFPDRCSARGKSKRREGEEEEEEKVPLALRGGCGAGEGDVGGRAALCVWRSYYHVVGQASDIPQHVTNLSLRLSP